MPRRSGSPRSLLSRQRAAVRALRSELFGADGTLGHPYFRDLARDLQDVEEPLSRAEVFRRCGEAGVVYVGDFHADPASQRFAADLLAQLREGSSDLALGVEFVHVRQQDVLDRRQRGELDDEGFLRRIHYREEWGYPQEGFLELLDRARHLGIEVAALDRSPRGGLDRIAERDDHAARRIASILAKDPAKRLVVLFGESHVSRRHLPHRVDRWLSRSGLAVRSARVYQDPDRVYWKLLEAGPLPEAVSLASGAFAVFHTPPLEKYERYRQVLVRWRGDADPGDDVDLTPAVHHLLRLLQGWLGIRSRRFRVRHRAGWVEDLEDAYPEVYSGGEAAELLAPVLREHGRTAEEIDEASARFAEQGALYESRSNTLFLSRYLPGRAAGEGARFLRTALTGRLFQPSEPSGSDPADRAYGAAYNEALVYLGARLVDPASDLVVPAAAPRTAWLDAHRRFEEGKRRNPPEAILAPLRGSRALRRALAREIGHRLGRMLFERVADGRMGTRALRHAFARPLEPGRAGPAVVDLLRRGRSS